MQSVIVHADELPWRPTPCVGVEWKKLFFDPASGHSVVLLRFAPDAAYDAHRHPAGEEYWVLEGTLEDGGHSYGAGTYVRHPPGSVHRPRSRTGCQVLVRLEAPIEPA